MHMLLEITLDEHDEPIIFFTHDTASQKLDQKLLGAFIRLAQQAGGIELHRALVHGDNEEFPLWDMHVRAKRPASDEH